MHDTFAQQAREGFALGRLAVKLADCAIQGNPEEKRNEKIDHRDIADVYDLNAAANQVLRQRFRWHDVGRFRGRYHLLTALLYGDIKRFNVLVIK